MSIYFIGVSLHVPCIVSHTREQIGKSVTCVVYFFSTLQRIFQNEHLGRSNQNYMGVVTKLNFVGKHLHEDHGR